MAIELTNQEIQVLLSALNATPVQGYASMQAVLALADKLQMMLKAEVEENA